MYWWINGFIDWWINAIYHGLGMEFVVSVGAFDERHQMRRPRRQVRLFVAAQPTSQSTPLLALQAIPHRARTHLSSSSSSNKQKKHFFFKSIKILQSNPGGSTKDNFSRIYSNESNPFQLFSTSSYSNRLHKFEQTKCIIDTMNRLSYVWSTIYNELLKLWLKSIW